MVNEIDSLPSFAEHVIEKYEKEREMKTVDLIQGSEEWLTYRKTKVGASEMSYLFGVNPWCKAKDQMLFLIGLKLGFNEIFINNAMRAGNEAEDAIVKHVENKYQIVTQPLIGYKGKISASFDGITLDNDIVVEVKNSAHTYNELKKHNRVPEMYQLQIQTQLYVSDADRCIFAARNPDTGDIVDTEVFPVENIIDLIKEKVDEFYTRMASKEEWTAEDFTEERTDEDWAQAAEEYRFAKRLYDEAKMTLDEAKQRLIENTDGASTKGGGVTVYKTKPRVTVNYRKIVEDNKIEIDEKYKKTGAASWAVRVTD